MWANFILASSAAFLASLGLRNTWGTASKNKQIMLVLDVLENVPSRGAYRTFLETIPIHTCISSYAATFFPPSGLKQNQCFQDNFLPTWQHGCNGKNLIGTTELTASNNHLSKLRVERELSHHRAKFCQITIVIQSSEVVQQLQCSHQCLRSWKQ